MRSVYDEVYALARGDPEWLLGRGRRGPSLGPALGSGASTTRARRYYRWFAGGMLNTCYNALDLHVDRGRGKQAALIYDSPVTGTVHGLHLSRAPR